MSNNNRHTTNPNLGESSSLKSSQQELRAVAEAKEHAEKVQQALLDIAALGGNVKNIQSFYQDIHSIVSRLMYARNCYIALVTPDCKHVKFEYSIDEKDENVDPTQWQPEPLESFKKRLTGYILRSGKSLLADTHQLKALENQGEIVLRGALATYWMGVPLIYDNKVKGVLAVQSYQNDISYTDEDKKVLTFVGQQISAALKQKVYEQKLHSYNEKLEQKVDARTAMLQQINQDMEKEILERKRAETLQAALFKISELTNVARDLDEFYLSLHKIINDIMPSKNLYIAVLSDDKKRISFPYYADEIDTTFGQDMDYSKPIEKASPTEQVLRTGKLILINKNNRQEWVDSKLIVGIMPETWLGVPLIEKNEVFGVLTIQSYLEGKSYTKLDAEVLMFVAQQISIALTRRKNAEYLQAAHEQMKKINDQLELRVDERTRELSVTNESLQKMLDERNEMQQKLSYEAFHDSLTGLANRTLFIDRMDQLLKRIKRDENITFSVFFLDLDRFKVINDSLGHILGDLLLKQVAERLLECVRPNDTVARLGGDEFCILLQDISNERDAAVIADRILKSFSTPFKLKDQQVFTSTSIGVTLNNKSYTSPESVLRDADAAMYHAKENGKDRYELFDVEMHENAMKRLEIESELRKAIQQKEIEVYYQPIVDLKTNKIIAFEALARWTHVRLGFISPNEFIPIAEETGLIYSLGGLVLNQALSQLNVWQSQLSEAKTIAMSVNFSSKQIEQHDLFADIKSSLTENKITPERLKVEITESLLIENAKLAQNLLQSLADLNIPVLLDDFGTGYSSLSYLHKFILNTIKIDRSFIFAMETNKKHYTIVKTIAFMAANLDLDVVAEGVETERHARILKDIGIRYAQGYYFSKPVSGDEALELIKYNKINY
ncbi:sensor domain-containing diguanylate cyclase [Aliikangiella sp. IMCC44359]|uniref:sensor domain-containing diguanylate cyclase n=1 Tax=Aliikangiella sp. IMCC44359 TaxID=3459125 RepID=UPI00403B0C7E